MTERSHRATSVFSGAIEVVPIDLSLESHDHLMDPEHLLHIAMTTQWIRPKRHRPVGLDSDGIG